LLHVVGVLTLLVVSGAGVAALGHLHPAPVAPVGHRAGDPPAPPGLEALRRQRRGHHELHVERRFFVPLRKIPQSLRDAVIATEDRASIRTGAWIRSDIGRAVGQNYRRGRIVEGGSTITQQLAKVLFLTPDKSLGRSCGRRSWRSSSSAVFKDRHPRPDADSLHVGNLLLSRPVVSSSRAPPVVLHAAATGLIGDRAARPATRAQSEEQVAEWADRLKRQVERSSVRGAANAAVLATTTHGCRDST